jgi:hypothetical protein
MAASYISLRGAHAGIENSEPKLLKELLAGIIGEIVVESRRSHRTLSRPVFMRLQHRGGGRESNPPTDSRRRTGFEDQEGHQAPVASVA